MRVLHYISSETLRSDVVESRLCQMLSATARVAENYVVSSSQLPDRVLALNPQMHYVVRPVGHNPLPYLLYSHKVKRIVREIKPDVVHVHGAWDFAAAMVERVARGMRIATIVSPHGMLTPVTMNDRFVAFRLPRLLIYQQSMARRCTALMAMSQEENEDIVQTGLRAKTRIETFADSSELMSYYRKALDSNYNNYITEAERDFVNYVVKKAVAKDELGMYAEKCSNTEDLSFRRIYLYAWDEDVTEPLLAGAKMLEIKMPPLPDIGALPRYKNMKAKQRGALSECKLPNTLKTIKIPADKKAERQAVETFQRAKALGIKKLTLRHWTELYALFRIEDFDEDIVSKELKRLGLLSFAKKIQKALSIEYLLPEGYFLE